MATGKTIARYTFLILHPILWTALFTINFLLIGNLPTFTLQIISALCILIYIPATLILSLRNSSSHFSSSGGEIIYLVIQQIIYLALTIIAGISNHLNPFCRNGTTLNGVTRKPGFCNFYWVLAGISLIHCLMLFGWMIMIIKGAGNVDVSGNGMNGTSGFAIPAYRLCSREYEVVEVNGGDVEKNQQERQDGTKDSFEAKHGLPAGWEQVTLPSVTSYPLRGSSLDVEESKSLTANAGYAYSNPFGNDEVAVAGPRHPMLRVNTK